MTMTLTELKEKTQAVIKKLDIDISNFDEEALEILYKDVVHPTLEAERALTSLLKAIKQQNEEA